MRDRNLLFLPVIFSLIMVGKPGSSYSSEPERISFPIGKGVNIKLLSSQNPQISADGRYVVFDSFGRLSEEDLDSTLDVYLYDGVTKTVRMIPGKDSKRYNGGPSISDDGEKILFHSTSKEDLKKRIPRTSDIVLYDVKEKTSSYLTLSPGGRFHDGEALFPKFTKQGSMVYFTSNGTNLVEEPVPPVRQIYSYDLIQAKLKLQSKNTEANAANRACAEPKMSADGTVLVYRSAATNLVPGIPAESLSVHIYSANVEENILVRIDDMAHGFDGNVLSAGAFDIDSEGRAVVFEGRWRDPEDHAAGLENIDLYLLTSLSGQAELITNGIFSRRSKSPSMSGDGRYIAFVFRPDKKEEIGDPGGLVVHDRKTDQWKRIMTGWCANPVISKDGSKIAFELIEEKKNSSKIKKRVRNVYVVHNPFMEEATER